MTNIDDLELYCQDQHSELIFPIDVTVVRFYFPRTDKNNFVILYCISIVWNIFVLIKTINTSLSVKFRINLIQY